MGGTDEFLSLLYAGAPEESFEEVVTRAREQGARGEELAALRRLGSTALLIREQMLHQRQREAELTALYETANDLIAIRDVDAILAAIARRARQLLGADMTYLSLNDEAEGASYMKVTDGSVSAEFRNLRLPLGTGLLGLVAQTGAPYYTDDYSADHRFKHRDYIDHAVEDERIRAILGVPLIVEGTVIGALLAGHRRVRAFPPEEVTLLTSFAAHAAVALENARLFEETEAAVRKLDAANRQITEQARAVELAAHAHDRLTDVLLRGGGVDDVATVLADVLGGALTVYDDSGLVVASVDGPGPPASVLADGVAESRTSGRCVDVRWDDRQVCVAAAVAGAEHLGTLVLHGRQEPLGLAERRTMERGAVVTALVLLFARSAADAEDRLRGELLADVLTGRAGDLQIVRERARRHRTDLDALAVVAVADVGGGERHVAARLASALARDLGGLGGLQEGMVVLVAPAADTGARAVGEALFQRLAARVTPAEDLVVGVAQAPDDGSGPAAVVAAWREARACVATLRTLGRAGMVADPAGLGLVRLLLGHNGPSELDSFLEATLGPLLDYDRRRDTDLVGTLEAWFRCGAKLVDTARALHIHPNTVAQRLERIGHLLGPDWRSPERGLDQQLALRLWRLRSTDRSD